MDPVSDDDGTRILVARYSPRGLPKQDENWAEWRKELGPSRELHAAWYGKGGRLKPSWGEYVERYEEEMGGQRAGIEELADRHRWGETITLLCHCADASHCHMSLLKRMIEAAPGEADSRESGEAGQERFYRWAQGLAADKGLAPMTPEEIADGAKKRKRTSGQIR